MNVTSRALVAYREGLVWTAVLIGIPAWLSHLVFVAAMTPYTTAHPGWRWTLHLATVISALPTLAGIAICVGLVRAANRAASDTPEALRNLLDQAETDDASSVTMSRFLGGLGILIGVSNLALILMEGSYVIFVRRGG